MDDDIDDFTRTSRFVVIYSGDDDIAQLANDWDSMTRLVMDCLWDRHDPPEWVKGVMEAIGHSHEWNHDDFGPFCFGVDLGESRLTIYRIQN